MRGKSERDLALPHLIMGLKSDMKLFTLGEMPTFREPVEWPFSDTECFKPLPWGEGRKEVLKEKIIISELLKGSSLPGRHCSFYYCALPVAVPGCVLGLLLVMRVEALFCCRLWRQDLCPLERNQVKP